MPPSSRSSRSLLALAPHPLLSAFGAGVLVLACSGPDDSGSLSSPYHHTGGGGSTGAGSSPSPSAGSSPATSGNAATGNGATSGPSSGSGSSPGQTPSSGPSAGAGSSSGGGASGSGGGTSEPPVSAVDASVSPPAAAVEFTVAIDDAAPALNLADSTVVNVTVTPLSGSGAGEVTLSATGLPSDVKGAFDNATLNLSGTTPVSAKLTLTSIDATKPVATPFEVVGTAGASTKNAAATLTVKSFITINIPVNADAMKTSFGTVHISAPANIATHPVTVNFVNLDSTPHEIHADNGNVGFSHGQGTFAQGQADSPVRKVTATGTYNWHLHDDAPPGGPPGGTVVIQ